MQFGLKSYQEIESSLYSECYQAKPAHTEEDPVQVHSSPESVIVRPIKRKVATAPEVVSKTRPPVRRSGANTATADKKDMGKSTTGCLVELCMFRVNTNAERIGKLLVGGVLPIADSSLRAGLAFIDKSTNTPPKLATLTKRTEVGVLCACLRW